mmetsp:Transcript_21481/g.46562  ORF Transcript_21481/g.46562 Transcript_21481/m.46562 type:complete len:234 (+) Transcript_21481:47-748(+)
MEMLLASAALGLLGLGTLPFAHAATNSYHQIRSNENQPLNSYFKVPPSVRQWDTLETPGAFTILSMAVDTHDRSPWYIQALHRRYSAGWNRTHEAAFSNRPHACVVRFLGVGREETVLEGFQTGGTGYMELSFKNERGKEQYLGFDKNETNRVHCYYRTQKDQGSEFLVSTWDGGSWHMQNAEHTPHTTHHTPHTIYNTPPTFHPFPAHLPNPPQHSPTPYLPHHRTRPKPSP